VALIDDVQAICQRLAQNGWHELLVRHGLDITVRDLKQELREDLPDIDRRIAGFEDFASEGRRGIEPGRPARSLLYHALASPNVLVGADGEPLGAFPTLAEIKTIENYVFGVRPPSLGELHKRFPRAPMAIVVFATEYRPGAQTVHRRHADLCFSRTGVARVGTAEPLYDARARGFVPFVEEEEYAFRVLPAQYAPYVAVQLKGNESLFGPMNFDLMDRVLKETGEDIWEIRPEYPEEQEELKDDAARNFWVPLHKLFSGPECLEDLDLSVGLEAHHVNQKIRRLHVQLQRLGHDGGWQKSDWDRSPFRFTDGIAEFSGDPESGEGVLTPIVHERLVEPAEYKGMPLHFRVPPEVADHPYYWDSGSSVHIYPEIFEGHYLVHHAPEYVNARHKVREDGTIKDLNDEPDVVRRVKRGDYDALHYSDFTGDGWIEARCPELADEFARRIPAYSVVTAVDFYPYCEQRELIEWWVHRVSQKLKERVWRRPPLTLSDSRIAPNLQLRGADFRAEDDTVTAIVSLPAESGVPPRHPLGRAATARHAHLPDAAASWFAPGWDTSLDATDGTMHLASYGLGSPFPEDAKLCAALSSVWPAVAPDAGRSFSNHYRTATPLTDEEVGIVGELPWDGVTGPRPTSHGDGRVYEYASYDHVDYVNSALDGRFTLSLTGQVDTAEYEARILAIARAYVALEEKLGIELYDPVGVEQNEPEHPWRVLSYRTVVSGDQELKRAEEEAEARLVGDRRDRLYRIVFGRVETKRKHPGDHRKVLVTVSRIVKLFGGTMPQVLVKDEGKPWQAFKTG
jgi:hypothetical protein